MKLHKVDFSEAVKAPLTQDDVYVLETIYKGRRKTFYFVFAVMFLSVGFRVLPMLLWPKDSLQFSGTLTGLVVIIILPFYVLYRKRVVPYRKDINSGIKYQISHQVIGKQFFEHTSQCFLSLDNVDYMHHEVDWDTYQTSDIGSSHPVYYAPHSKYAFNQRARITWM